MSNTPRTDRILALIPGGQSCDPQKVADELREKMQEMERELEISKQSESLTRIENKQLRDAIQTERSLAYKLAISISMQEFDGGHVPPRQASALAAWEEARQ